MTGKVLDLLWEFFAIFVVAETILYMGETILIFLLEKKDWNLNEIWKVFNFSIYKGFG